MVEVIYAVWNASRNVLELGRLDGFSAGGGGRVGGGGGGGGEDEGDIFMGRRRILLLPPLLSLFLQFRKNVFLRFRRRLTLVMVRGPRRLGKRHKGR